MNQDLHLFIAGKEIDFKQDPQILYNYTIDDASNPTVVKNSFSKTITIEGTPNNNDVFGHIWNLERAQYYGSGNIGAEFNPLKKTDFVIYLNGEIYESGYVKLDEVKKKGESVEYNITLYGGLGSFFYNLTYSHSDNINEGGPDKMSLNDLVFRDESQDEVDLDFTINKDTVNEAWDAITDYHPTKPNSKWDYVNFAPCYNGIPDDFDAAKVLVNYNGLSTKLSRYFTQDSKTYRTFPVNNSQNNGFGLGEAGSDLTEWETKDLRSYNQRPVFNMKKIIEACCRPENNGGYEVVLDKKFFNDQNPYYEKAWVTLPMLRKMDIKGGQEQEVTENVRINQTSSRFWDINVPVESFSSFNNLSMVLDIKYKPSSPTSAPYLYSTTHYETTKTGWNAIFQGGTYPKWYETAGAVIVQLVAFDAAGSIVGYSNAYVMGGSSTNAHSSTEIYKYFAEDNVNPVVNVDKYEFVKGKWKRDTDGSYYFADYYSGNRKAIKFTLNSATPFASLKLKVKTPWSYAVKYLFSDSASMSSGNYNNFPLFSAEKYVSNTRDTDSVVRNLNKVSGTFGYEISQFSLIATDYEGLFSDTKIHKKDYLTTSGTPCDYLLSYAKMFGLYFYKQPDEDTIYIMTRDTFYEQNKIVNLDKLIDRSKDMKITPQVPETKWYDFNNEQVESEANNVYKDTYGRDYGMKRVNTGYNFDSESTKLLEDNLFRGAIDILEKDKYFNNPVEAGLQPYIWNKFSVTLYAQGADEIDSADFDNTVMVIPQSSINSKLLKNYDCFAKPQFHTEDNSAGEGENVLLFYTGAVNTYGEHTVDYWLTDDVDAMASLNDSTPCWIMTASEYDYANRRIAIKRNLLPSFSRNIIFPQSGYIVATWDMGPTQEVFLPETYITDGSNIYDRCWRNFIGDMYSSDTKILSCYCRVEDRPNPDWLRRFYWFDNAIWRLNKIKDWNVAGLDSTQMEFIKVQDMANYKLEEINTHPVVYFEVDKNVVPKAGGVITARIWASDGGFWYLENYDGVSVSKDRGSGAPSTVTFYFSPNTTGLTKTFDIVATDGDYSFVHQVFTQSGDKEPLIVEPQVITVDYDNVNTQVIKIRTDNNFRIEVNDIN